MNEGTKMKKHEVSFSDCVAASLHVRLLGFLHLELCWSPGETVVACSYSKENLVF